MTPGSAELLALVDKIRAGIRYGEGFSREECAGFIAKFLAAKPAKEEGCCLTALVDARPYVASAYKRSQHAYDKAALEQIDDAILTLSTTGQPKP